jgi:hypothetical protein
MWASTAERLATRVTLVLKPRALPQNSRPFALVLDRDQYQRAVRRGEGAVSGYLRIRVIGCHSDGWLPEDIDKTICYGRWLAAPTRPARNAVGDPGWVSTNGSADRGRRR